MPGKKTVQIAALAAFSLLAGPTPASAQSNPNILLVIADDMGLDATTCYDVGANQATMPNLETLCAEGLVFENAYSAPLCSPTRASIMTGKYGFRTGVGSAVNPEADNGLSDDEKSLFDVLGQAQYSTALIGKWHLSDSPDDIDHPASLGVSEFFGIFTGGAQDYYNWTAVHNGAAAEVSGYTTSILTNRAISWISQQDQPWFLWLAYNAPHAPFHTPPSDLHSRGDLPNSRKAIRSDRATYYNAALEALDTEMGRLLNSIPPDEFQNTVVIFLGDNGSPNQVTGNLYGERGAKGSLFEGGTHIPLVFYGPGIKPGRNEALVNTTDLFATIAGLAGAEVRTRDSIDLWPVVQGGAGNRKYAYVEHFSDVPPRRENSHGWAIRDERFKLVSIDGLDEMLFDLEIDPFEEIDLLESGPTAEYKEVAAKLKDAYRKIRGEN
ncbi:MAG: sulfatase-like hydrolase/transferase [Pseudomonadota bacterium]